jgi:hypothetical protein
VTGRARLLRCYPPAWRERYGDDLAAYLDDTYPGRLPVCAVASLVAGGVCEWVRSARASTAALPAAARMRAGALMVLAGWASFVVAGSAFAKISEHYDGWLSDHNRTVPDVAYTVVQDVATACGFIVVFGLVLAVPALLRLLSSGGWSLIRGHVMRATVATALTAGMTIAVAAWAHRLSAAQRNGGHGGYAAIFLVWAALVALMVALWTVAAIATARRLTLSRQVLLAQGALAAAVTTGMLVMLVAVAVWFVAMASSAPAFFGGARDFTAAWTPQLIATATVMVAALVAGTVGVIRIARAAGAQQAGEVHGRPQGLRHGNAAAGRGRGR